MALLCVMGLGQLASALTDGQQMLLNMAQEVATNETVNFNEAQLITHQELNRLLEILRDQNLGAKDLVLVLESVRRGNGLKDDQRTEAITVLSDILTVRLKMDEYLTSYKEFRCAWRIKEDPRQTVAADSPMSTAFMGSFEGRNDSIRPIRENERVVVAVCGNQRRR